MPEIRDGGPAFPHQPSALRQRIEELERQITRLLNEQAELVTIAIMQGRQDARDEIKRLREALERIASCQSHHPDDAVAVARAALGRKA